MVEKYLNTAQEQEFYLRGYLWGNRSQQEEAKWCLYGMFPEERKKKYVILAGYMANAGADVMEEIDRSIHMLKRLFHKMDDLDLYEEQLKLRVLIFQASEMEMDEFFRAFTEKMVRICQTRQVEIPWAADTCDCFEDWPDTLLGVQKTLDYGISQGCRDLIQVDKVRFLQQKDLVYPLEVEKKIFTAIETFDYPALKQHLEEFLLGIAKPEYAPEDIRRAVLGLMIRMGDMANEINRKAYHILREKRYMHQVLNARTLTEIRGDLYEMGEIICTMEHTESISNYTINRTIEYIRIHYKKGITLEGTAKMLGITPEYLSALFKNEMGMNFSVFLKKFRISHAKRMLKGTDLKIFEIAEECGYNNANYFAKVFKEETGVSPMQFRT